MNYLSRKVVVFCVLMSLCMAPAIWAATLYVPDDYPSIKSAIRNAESGDTILVRDGHYTGAENCGIALQTEKYLALISENGPENCIIDCEDQDFGIKFQYNDQNSSYMNGFTFTRGVFATSGGALTCRLSSPVIENCTFLNSHAENGGGVALEWSEAVLINCDILGNTTDYDGAGVHIYKGSPTLYNCRIHHNSASDQGGGVLIYSEHTTVCPTLFNCLIYDNYSNSYGGGIDIHQGFSQIINCTFARNQSSSPGGGVSVRLASNPEFLNCIIWDNEPDSCYITNTDTSIHFSDVQGGYSGNSNIDLDPLFHIGNQGEFYLRSTEAGQNENSPCIDTGFQSADQTCQRAADQWICLSDLTTTTDHNPDSMAADMGYHYPIPPSPTPGPTATPVCTSSELTLEMPFHNYLPGRFCWLIAHICNAGSETLVDHVACIALEVAGQYWFAPSWTTLEQEFCYYRLDFPSGLYDLTVIPSFPWPDISGSASNLRFWGVLFDPEISNVIGNIDTWEFSYSN